MQLGSTGKRGAGLRWRVISHPLGIAEINDPVIRLQDEVEHKAQEHKIARAGAQCCGIGTAQRKERVALGVIGHQPGERFQSKGLRDFLVHRRLFFLHIKGNLTGFRSHGEQGAAAGQPPLQKTLAE